MLSKKHISLSFFEIWFIKTSDESEYFDLQELIGTTITKIFNNSY